MTRSSDIDADRVAILDWYQAMGVDCTLTAEPIDWRARSGQKPATSGDAARPIQPPASEVPNQRPPAQSPASAVPMQPGLVRTPADAVSVARAQAAQADSFEALEAVLKAFDGCGLSKTATNLCFYRGSQSAPLAIIGEAPGRDEDLSGKPFVGRAGQLLDKMLAAIGLDEGDVHITNTVYWRPPGNRTPTPVEAQTCRPFLERQIDLLQPKLVLVLGGAAAKNVFDTNEGIMRLRGKWRQWTVNERDIPVMASLHPAYLLRTPAAKRLAWRDLIEVKCALDKQRQ